MFRQAELNPHTVPEPTARALADGHTATAELDHTDTQGGPICAGVPPPLIHGTIDETDT